MEKQNFNAFFSSVEFGNKYMSLDEISFGKVSSVFDSVDNVNGCDNQKLFKAVSSQENNSKQSKNRSSVKYTKNRNRVKRQSNGNGKSVASHRVSRHRSSSSSSREHSPVNFFIKLKSSRTGNGSLDQRQNFVPAKAFVAPRIRSRSLVATSGRTDGNFVQKGISVDGKTTSSSRKSGNETKHIREKRKLLHNDTEKKSVSPRSVKFKSLIDIHTLPCGEAGKWKYIRMYQERARRREARQKRKRQKEREKSQGKKTSKRKRRKRSKSKKGRKGRAKRKSSTRTGKSKKGKRRKSRSRSTPRTGKSKRSAKSVSRRRRRKA